MRSRSTFALAAALAALALTCGARWAGPTGPDAVLEVGERWVHFVNHRDPAAFDLLDRESARWFTRLGALARDATPETLRDEPVLDQLRVMLLRSLAPSPLLEAGSERALFRFALEQGLLGAEIRALDELRELHIDGDRASGRLVRAGSDGRRSRSVQHFRREGRHWRISLTGEHARLGRELASFAARRRISASEAAFWILEMRLARKVSPEDFGPAGSTSAAAMAQPEIDEKHLRVVAIRLADAGAAPAATIEDRARSLRFVVSEGDAIPGHPEVRVGAIGADAVTLLEHGDPRTMRLEPDGPALSERAAPTRAPSLFAFAVEGSGRAGPMAQWRNVGLRDRPLLLQQARLSPRTVGPAHRIDGIRVDERTEHGFWHQLGLEPGDLVVAVDGRPIASLDDWKRLIDAAEGESEIRLDIERDGAPLRLHTRTVRPHASSPRPGATR